LVIVVTDCQDKGRSFGLKMKKTTTNKATSSSDCIKKAARELFMRKGLDGARNEEIAAISGTSPALISYYFKGKEKLFDEILIEVFAEFIVKVEAIANEPYTNFETKVRQLVDCYSELVIESPHLPLNALMKIRKKHAGISNYTKQMRNMLHHSIMAQQLRREVSLGKYKDITIAHVVMNIVGLTLFPALAAPIIQTIGDMREEQYQQLIRDRQEHIADWVLFTLR
jgi:AcrR family transcriptional regulator